MPKRALHVHRAVLMHYLTGSYVLEFSERVDVEIPQSEYRELTTASRMVRYLGTLA